MFDILLRSVKVDKGVFRISGLAVYRYLFCGDKQTVLWDTGYGIGNIKKVAENLSDAPVTVVNSHFHPDHSGGNYRFRKVYINENDMPFDGNLAYEKVVDAVLPAFIEEHPRLRIPARAFAKSINVRKGRTKYVPVKDGFTFDLGDRELVMRHLQGHTEGCCVLCDKDRHNIYTGDSCNHQFWMWTNPDCSLAEYADNLDKFYDQIKNDGYERIICSHSPITDRPDYFKDYAKFVRGIRKGSARISFNMPGLDDKLCIKIKPSIKHKDLLMCFYLDNQAAGESPKKEKTKGKLIKK